MILMSRLTGLRGLTVGAMLLALLWTAGCERPVELQSGDGTAQADQHPVPFHEDNGKSSHASDSSPAQDGGLKPETVPFHDSLAHDPQTPRAQIHDSQSLPSGTLLTVRLNNSIFADKIVATDAFEAVVDQPVVIEGNKLIPLGATVSGRVESARASHLTRNRGCVRLVLDSINVAGLDVPVKTSSLFVRGKAGQTQTLRSEVSQGEASTTVMRLEKGRRLIFRLTEPVYVAGSQRPPSEH
jgi:hypothetical protein